MNNISKNLVMWLVIAVVLMTIFNNFAPRQLGNSKQLEYSSFLADVKQGQVSKVVIAGQNITATRQDGTTIKTFAPNDPDLINDLLRNGVVVDAKEPEQPSLLMSIFISWFPLLLLIGVWIFFMRQMQGGGGRGAMSFGKSLSLIHISEPTRLGMLSRMPSSA